MNANGGGLNITAITDADGDFTASFELEFVREIACSDLGSLGVKQDCDRIITLSV